VSVSCQWAVVSGKERNAFSVLSSVTSVSSVRDSLQSGLSSVAYPRGSGLFGQAAGGKAGKYDQEHKGGGAGKFVVTLPDKHSKHQEHAQDWQQNE
jgi:hypothetical protein